MLVDDVNVMDDQMIYVGINLAHSSVLKTSTTDWLWLCQLHQWDSKHPITKLSLPNDKSKLIILHTTLLNTF